MKATLREYDGAFGISMEPETMAEVSMLVRFGLNATKELKFLSVGAYRGKDKDPEVHSTIHIGKRKQNATTVTP